MMALTCPLCGAHDTGRIGRKRYYCHECCLEWTENSGELKIFRIGSDGILCQMKYDQCYLSFGLSKKVTEVMEAVF